MARVLHKKTRYSEPTLSVALSPSIKLQVPPRYRDRGYGIVTKTTTYKYDDYSTPETHQEFRVSRNRKRPNPERFSTQEQLEDVLYHAEQGQLEGHAQHDILTMLYAYGYGEAIEEEGLSK